MAATGSEYFSHPWLNHHVAPLLDTSKKSALAKAAKSDLSAEDAAIYKSFEAISEFPGVEYAIVSDFLAHAPEADLLRFYSALSDLEEFGSVAQKLSRKSKVVKKLLKKSEGEELAEKADVVRGEISTHLRTVLRLWASRGLFRETVTDGEPRSRQWRLDQLNYEGAAIANAESILVLGGGEVSLETASDIIERYPNKKVTILHNGVDLLGARQNCCSFSAQSNFPYSISIAERTSSNRAHKNLNSFFKKHGVEIILGDSLKAWRPVGSKYVVETSAGKIMTFAKIIVGFGGKPRNGPFQKYFAEKIDGTTGRVTVDASLRMTDNIFVMGDVSGADRMSAYAAGEQGELVGKNLVSVVRGKKLAAYSKAPAVILVCLGHTITLLVFGNLCIMAGKGGFSRKDGMEKAFLKSLGQTVDIDKNWTKEFVRMSQASASSSSSTDA